MSNWHIKIADCNEAQKEVLKRVYGNLPININTYFGLHNGIVIGTFGPDSMGELITPDEAFERLGLDVNYTVNKLIEANEALCEKIKELEQENLEHAFNKRGTDLSQTRQANRALCKQITKLQQQLAAKPYDYPIDWSVLPQECCHIGQHKKGGATVSQFALFSREEWPGVQKHYHLIATRPKPKYTKEQIEAAKAYDEWLDLNNGDFESDCFEAWLKEVGND